MIKLKDLLTEGSKFDIKLRNLLESTLGSHYPGDAGEKETGYLRGGKTRHLGIKAGKPEPWFEGGGYEQMDFPVADFIYGKAAPEDMVVKKKVIRAIEPVTKFNENLREASKLTDTDIKLGEKIMKRRPYFGDRK
jgi:hypothetical protein